MSKIWSERYIALYVRYPLLLSDFKATRTSSTVFRKRVKYQNFMKICPVRTELLHANRRTDRYDEANSRFSQICVIA
jgi:hypothetical protein